MQLADYPATRAEAKRILTDARSLVAHDWLRGSGYAQGLAPSEHEAFSASWSERYQPQTHTMDKDATDVALRMLAEAATGEEVPEAIPPIHVLSNWNERAERTQADVLAAYDRAIRQVTS